MRFIITTTQGYLAKNRSYGGSFTTKDEAQAEKFRSIASAEKLIARNSFALRDARIVQASEETAR